jgi:GNAT superfamily N-acetyltransferase
MQYNLGAVLDQKPVRICGIGAVFTEPTHHGGGHAGVLIERLLAAAARDGAEVALLFSEMGPECYAPNGFAVIPTTESSSA